MDSPTKNAIVRRWPLVTIAIVTVAATVWFVPELRDCLIYDRDAILRGELWRLFAGQFVHFSLSHLVYDVAAIVIVGSVLEMEARRSYTVLCLLASLCISAALIVFEPDMGFCGGLSGLATCFVMVLAMKWTRAGGMWCAIGLAALALAAWKLYAELQTTNSLFADLGPELLRSRYAHLAGALTGLLWSVFEWATNAKLARRVIVDNGAASV